MNRDEWIARLAEGDTSLQATEWLELHPDARLKVEQLKRILAAATFKIESPPAEWISRAQDIFPAGKANRVAS